jgi:hypothetical protein
MLSMGKMSLDRQCAAAGGHKRKPRTVNSQEAAAAGSAHNNIARIWYKWESISSVEPRM